MSFDLVCPSEISSSLFLPIPTSTAYGIIPLFVKMTAQQDIPTG
jgi:hypothetical protein